MTTKLKLFREAARNLGDRTLDSLSEETPLRRALDAAYDNGNFVDYVLARGFWRFAKRSARLDYTPSIDTSDLGGYRYVFEMPEDYATLIKVTTDPYFRNPILEYDWDRNCIVCDYEEIYVMYVSNDDNYGGDLTNWPQTFADYASIELAVRACKRILESDNDKEILKTERDKALSIARSLDAMKEPTRFRPVGEWLRSRGSRNSIRSPRG